MVNPKHKIESIEPCDAQPPQHHEFAQVIVLWLLFKNSVTLHKQYMQMLSKHGAGFLMVTLCSPIHAISEKDMKVHFVKVRDVRKEGHDGWNAALEFITPRVKYSMTKKDSVTMVIRMMKFEDDRRLELYNAMLIHKDTYLQFQNRTAKDENVGGSAFPAAIRKFFDDHDSMHSSIDKRVTLGNSNVFVDVDISNARCVQCGKEGLLKQHLQHLYKEDRDRLAQLSICGGCKLFAYCSKECQLQHWNDRHKCECASIKEYYQSQTFWEYNEYEPDPFMDV